MRSVLAVRPMARAKSQSGGGYDGNREACIGERERGRASVPAGGFEHDAVEVVERLESFDQFGVAAPVGLTQRG